jgi:hypothetical protein
MIFTSNVLYVHKSKPFVLTDILGVVLRPIDGLRDGLLIFPIFLFGIGSELPAHV